MVKLRVADDGLGSTAEPKPDVVGSGRSIVDALVRNELGGRVEYHSSARGTEVNVIFPVAS